MTATHISATGHACKTLGMVPSQLQEWIAKLGIQPAMVINGVPHYSEADLRRIELARQDENPLLRGRP